MKKTLLVLIVIPLLISCGKAGDEKQEVTLRDGNRGAVAAVALPDPNKSASYIGVSGTILTWFNYREGTFYPVMKQPKIPLKQGPACLKMKTTGVTLACGTVNVVYSNNTFLFAITAGAERTRLAQSLSSIWKLPLAKSFLYYMEINRQLLGNNPLSNIVAVQ